MATNGSPQELTPRQRKAIAALLAAKDAKTAAQAANVGERTIYRWLTSPAFRAELASAEGELIDHAERVLLAGQSTALKTLLELMTRAESETTRRQAAANWLDFTLRWRERNVEQRLAELERLVLNVK